MLRSEQYSFLQDLGNTPQIGLLCAPNKENLRVTRLSAIEALQLVRVLPTSLQSLLGHPPSSSGDFSDVVSATRTEQVKRLLVRLGREFGLP